MKKNGSVGLFDTKGDLTARVAGPKAEALAKYIKGNKKLFGGIVLKDKNSWKYHDGLNYEYKPNDLKKWKFLELN